MPRPQLDSPYLFGLHEPGGEQHMTQAGRRGWLVFTEAIGSESNDHSGKNFAPWSNQGFGVLCRLNNGYEPSGTIPHSSRCDAFAQRCANFVAASRGCKSWIIGNEMNHPVERPGVRIDWSHAALLDGVARGHMVPWRFNALQPAGTHAARMTILDPGEVITPELYARCYRLCRDAIKRIPGHANDQVLIGAVAPWNNLTTYAGNANGDWVQYYRDILTLIGAGNCDGITLHTYTHGADPALLASEQRLNPPFQQHRYHFRAYRDFLAATPPALRSLPVYITETDQDAPWENSNNGWIKAAYAEINAWNKQAGNQPVRALVLYRWPARDQWAIEGKQGVIDDFRGALQQDYQWSDQPPNVAPPAFVAGDAVTVASAANLRRTPGHIGKPANDVLATLPAGAACTVLAGPQVVNALEWWQLRCTVNGQALPGWLARTAPDGEVLLRKATATPPPATGTIQIGSKVRTIATVNLRRTPGTTNKPANDLLTQIPANATATVSAGPATANGLRWWGLIFYNAAGQRFNGWAAEATTAGPLLTPEAAPPPPAAGQFQVGQRIYAAGFINLRQTAGTTNKPPTDIIAAPPRGAGLTVLAGPQMTDGLTWWQVRYVDSSQSQVDGWAAESNAQGTALLAAAAPPPLSSSAPLPTASFKVGDVVVNGNLSAVNVRRTPGYKAKPANDLVGTLPPDVPMMLVEGPRAADDLTWWRVAGAVAGVGMTGWAAEVGPVGERFLLPVQLKNSVQLSKPFSGTWRVTQLFGERPEFYQQFSYDGVPLRGHNGLDFGTPNDTDILATDAGKVMQVGYEANGFGNFVKLDHPWGDSLYAHLKSVGVAEGDVVARGAVLGKSDNTGNSSGPHLHFAIRIYPYKRGDGWGGTCDPAPFMNPADLVLSNLQALGMLKPSGMAPDAPGYRRP